jgi:hypothetical protein
MGRELFIVSRDRPDLYRYLTQTFGDAENVEVIWDRRTRERRVGGPGGATSERRQRERRVNVSVEEELKTVGYSFLALD